MRKFIMLCASLCTMAFVVSSKPAHAQVLAWVSPTGNNTGTTCSETAPCATFQYAVSNVSGVTQINCLGSGNYGPVAITGSLVIDCGAGNIGEIASTVSGVGINIISNSAATIVLRHLSLNGGGAAGTTGIYTEEFVSGTLIVEDCIIHGYHSDAPVTGLGIYFAPSNGRGTLQVSDSLLYDNETAIYVSPATGQIASVALNRDELTANVGTALLMLGSGVVAGTIRQSLVGENGAAGVYASASQVYFTVEESSIVDNLDDGIETVSSGAIINVGASTIGGNGTGVQAQPGSIISFGNNQMSANGTNGSFTSTTPLQ
jgi:hypothetical protein